MPYQVPLLIYRVGRHDMTAQELGHYQRGEYLHSGLFLKDVPLNLSVKMRCSMLLNPATDTIPRATVALQIVTHR